MKIYDEQHNFAGYLVKDKDGYCLSGASDSSVKNVNLFRKRIRTGMPWNKELLYWLAVCEAMAFFGCLVSLCVPTPAKDNVYCFLFVPSGLFFIFPPFCLMMRFIITFICGLKRRYFFIPAAFEFVEGSITVGFMCLFNPSDYYDLDYESLVIFVVFILIIVEIIIFWLNYEFISEKNDASAYLISVIIVSSCVLLFFPQSLSFVKRMILVPFLYHLICFILFVYLIHKMNFVKPSVKES